MIKKFFILLLITAGMVGLAIWSPWENWDVDFSQYLPIETTSETASLEIYSLKDSLTLFIDGEEIGTVSPETGVLYQPINDEKVINVSLQKIKDDSPVGYVFNQPFDYNLINSAVIAYELGPSKEFSQGHVLTVFKDGSADSTSSDLIISSEPDEVDISLNDSLVTDSSLSLPISQTHNLKFEKDNYETLEFEIFPEDQDARNNLGGKRIEVDVRLFSIPIDIN